MAATEKLTGEIEIFYRYPDGSEDIVEKGKNSIQYEGFDALAKIMTGEIAGSINAMYFKFNSTGTAVTEDPVGRGNNAALFQSLAAPWDIARVEMTNGVRTAQNSLYNGNQATFVGVAETGATGAVNGLSMGTAADITMLALVVAPAWNDITQDLVYAAYAPSTVISPPVNAAVGWRWKIQFAYQA